MERTIFKSYDIEPSLFKAAVALYPRIATLVGPNTGFGFPASHIAPICAFIAAEEISSNGWTARQAQAMACITPGEFNRILKIIRAQMSHAAAKTEEDQSLRKTRQTSSRISSTTSEASPNRASAKATESPIRITSLRKSTGNTPKATQSLHPMIVPLPRHDYRFRSLCTRYSIPDPDDVSEGCDRVLEYLRTSGWGGWLENENSIRCGVFVWVIREKKIRTLNVDNLSRTMRVDPSNVKGVMTSMNEAKESVLLHIQGTSPASGDEERQVEFDEYEVAEPTGPPEPRKSSSPAASTSTGAGKRKRDIDADPAPAVVQLSKGEDIKRLRREAGSTNTSKAELVSPSAAARPIKRLAPDRRTRTRSGTVTIGAHVGNTKEEHARDESPPTHPTSYSGPGSTLSGQWAAEDSNEEVTLEMRPLRSLSKSGVPRVTSTFEDVDRIETPSHPSRSGRPSRLIPSDVVPLTFEMEAVSPAEPPPASRRSRHELAVFQDRAFWALPGTLTDEELTEKERKQFEEATMKPLSV